MSSPSVVVRTLRQRVAASLSPEQQAARLAAFAKRDLAQRIARGEAPPVYRRFVDGREGAAEETVRAGGAILYRFQALGQAALFGLDYARAASLPSSVKFKAGFFFSVRGRMIRPESFDPQKVDADVKELFLLNNLPFQRQVSDGWAGTRQVDYHPAEKEFWTQTMRAIRRRYPQLDADYVARMLFPGQWRYKRPGRNQGKPVDSPAIRIAIKR